MNIREILEGQRCWKGYEKKGTKIMFGKRVNNCVKKEDVDFCVNCGELVLSETLNEDLKKWFKQKWVRFGPKGKIRGACGGKSKGEGKPKMFTSQEGLRTGQERQEVSGREETQTGSQSRTTW